MRRGLIRFRSVIAYVTIAALFLATVVWQVLGQARDRTESLESMHEVARRIASNLSLIVQSQEQSGLLYQAPLKSAFDSFTSNRRTTKSVALLNAAGEVLASGGAPLSIGCRRLIDDGLHEADGTITIAVEYMRPEGFPADAPPPVVLPGPAALMPFLPGPDMGGDLLNRSSKAVREQVDALSKKDALSPGDATGLLASLRAELAQDGRAAKFVNALAGQALTPETLDDAVRALLYNVSPQEGPPETGRIAPGSIFSNLSAQEYGKLLEERGARYFVCSTDTSHWEERLAEDFWRRVVFLGVAAMAALGLALAWRHIERAAQLELGLVSARERNVHLQNMNLAAVGLAHETKNPLNVIRGQAQLIAKRKDLPPEVAERSRAIVEESDRVTARLNQFMDYSKPIEPKYTACKPGEVARDVARALDMVLADRNIKVQMDLDSVEVEADPALLRQVLFNLMLNAANALESGGNIKVSLDPEETDTVSLLVADNGPGVPESERENIFLPYYSRTAKGTGLGLAIVRQIAQGHHWEIHCAPVPEGGACFRIDGMRLTPGERG